MAKTNDIADLIAEAALRRAGTVGWRALALADVAAEAGVSLAELASCYESGAEILAGFERLIDRRMLAGATGDFGDTQRDRLFALVMERFDALTPFRAGVRRVSQDLPHDPAAALTLACALPRSVAWMAEGARISLDGPLFPVRLAALTGLYVSVFRVWLDDESADLAKTMAALDRRLARVAGLFGKGFTGKPAASADPLSPPPGTA
jgi:AcrR family transcriptional regulator